GSTVFLQVQWKAAVASPRRSYRVPTPPYGTADYWIESSENTGELAMLFKIAGAGIYTAPGLLVSVSNRFSSLQGSETRLRLSPIPKEWWEKSPAIASVFEQSGFFTSVNEFAVELRCELSPADAIEKATAMFLALD